MAGGGYPEPDGRLSQRAIDYYVARAKAVVNGDWESGDTWGGLDTGMVEMAPYNEIIPANVVAEAEAAVAGIKDGSLHPFTGPINGQDGAERVPAGQKLDDGALLSMDWYVEGVQASSPN